MMYVLIQEPYPLGVASHFIGVAAASMPLRQLKHEGKMVPRKAL